ncbi:MAG TPA: hypothetical protein VGI81_22755 [Tepidisphaeraceae bacterium]|jgi:hypothetical protein
MSSAAPPTIESLATKMPDRKGVLWAVESCKLVKSKMSPLDQQASAAAEQWVKQPTPANQAAAAAAAKKTDYQGPGAWAAQAVAWAPPGAGAAPSASVPLASGITPNAAGSARGTAPGVVPLNVTGGGHSSAALTGSLVSVAVAGSVSIAAALFAGVKPPANQPTAVGTAPQPAGPSSLPGAPKVPAMPGVPKLPPMPPPPSPAELTKIAHVQKPFIDLGQKILLDKSPL